VQPGSLYYETPPTRLMTDPLRIAYLTAGGAGMFCGSCMHDNTLARALIRRGVDCQLLPLYTPIRTDEENVSSEHLLFSGLNVYLQQKYAFFRWLPGWMDWLFERPWLVKLATSFGVETDARLLGAMTVSMLRGHEGNQRKEVDKLCRWLRQSQPDLVVLTNMLIAGCAPDLKRELGVPVLVTLQGDDIFLDELQEPFKSQTFELLRQLDASVDGYLTFSNFYADYMAEYLGIDRQRIQLVPLGIDTDQFAVDPAEITLAERPPTIGYLARLVPEKGLHVMVDAFIRLRTLPGMDQARLRIAGWYGAKYRPYVHEQQAKIEQAGLTDAVEILGTVDRRRKLEFLRGIDCLSTPSLYRDPKGLYVLEALAAGVPVVQPNHGAFPELLAAVGGGHLVEPNNPEALAAKLHEVLLDREALRTIGSTGRQAVLERHNADAMADGTLAVYKRYLRGER